MQMNFLQPILRRYTAWRVIGLRYFNVFGRRQDPDGPYAAVIPKFLKMLKDHQRPVINGNGSNSRDFTFIDNVIQANHLAGLVPNPEALNQVYNVAFGERTTLYRMFELIREFAGKYDKSILKIEPEYGPERGGDIPHSHASIEKAKKLLGYFRPMMLQKDLKKQLTGSGIICSHQPARFEWFPGITCNSDA